MNSEAELLQRLMISKKIMEKHDDIGRGQARNITSQESYSSPMVESYDAIPATYNLPQEYLEEQRPVQQVNNQVPLEDRISNSKLPDEIKKLMMEHPLQQPTMGVGANPVLSNELIEKASRLMNTNAKGDVMNESRTRRQVQSQPSQPTSSLSAQQIKDIVRETMEEVLSENGLLVESESKSGEMFKFRVGQHLFEGKVLKVKKMAK
jgi:hypothetical protein